MSNVTTIHASRTLEQAEQQLSYVNGELIKLEALVDAAWAFGDQNNPPLMTLLLMAHGHAKALAEYMDEIG